MTNTPLTILQKYWSYTSFKPLQEEIITSVLSGEDTFALLPTGGGKSICFQIPALLNEGICIVVSPLIALMQDQIKNLQDKNIKALAITGGIKHKELDTLLDNCIYGNYKFLYLSPERLQQELVQERIKQMNVNLIAIDEAHCISQWGNDFRPSYKKIELLRRLHPTIPMIALTASATTEVVKDVVIELDLFQPKILKQSFYRDNLAYNVLDAPDKNHTLVSILNKIQGTSILYVRNRKSAVELSTFLNQSGHTATYYHGGVDAEEKKKRFNQWIKEEVRVMVATNAFGMGIDKSNVRTVIHYTLPESIESYFQEAGRAGRDGKPASTFLLKNQSDKQRLNNQFIKVLPSADHVKLVYRKLSNYFRIPYGEGEQSTHSFDFNTFCKTYQLNTLLTYNAILFLDRCGVIRFMKKYTHKSSIHILTSGNQLIDFVENNIDHELIIKAILRTYSGIFDEKIDINIPMLASKINKPEGTIIEVLKKLNDTQLLDFEYVNADAELIFLVPREDDITINSIRHHLTKQNESKIKKVEAILEFTQNTTDCKSKLLLRYFGELKSEDCGICSFCINKNKTASTSDYRKIQNDILKLLANKEQSSRDLEELLNCSQQDLLIVLRELNAHKVIRINNNKYQLA